ncbi:MAG: hypothetical protein WKF31_07870 [Thermoleophilaceae bacterium]
MNNGFWVASLIGGAVVLVAVVALLTLLYATVRSIDGAVNALIEPGQGARANTAKINDLLTTAHVLEEIKEEALIHDDFLARRR